MGETNVPPSMRIRPGGSDAETKVNAFTVFISMAVLFGAVVLVVLVYHYAQHYWRSARRRAQLIYASGELPDNSLGLDPAVLRSLPVTLYKPSDFKEGLECAVCLSELTAGEKARLLGKCGHGFHLECIDMWLESHTTCPVCRCFVGLPASGKTQPPVTSEVDRNRLSESSSLPDNTRFWGNQNRAVENSGSSLSSGRMLVISIPVRTIEGFPPSLLPSSRSRAEELKSPVQDDGSPAESKIKSLRRLLSTGKITGGSSCSTSGIGDIEQGMVEFVAENGVGSYVSQNSPKTSGNSL